MKFINSDFIVDDENNLWFIEEVNVHKHKNLYDFTRLLRYTIEVKCKRYERVKNPLYNLIVGEKEYEIVEVHKIFNARQITKNKVNKIVNIIF